VACSGGHVQMKVAVMKRKFLRDSELFGCQDGITLELVGTAFLSGGHVERSVQICHESKRMGVGGTGVAEKWLKLTRTRQKARQYWQVPTLHL
jgi:hypothetical protein